jgi:hypothetical protein
MTIMELYKALDGLLADPRFSGREKIAVRRGVFFIETENGETLEIESKSFFDKQDAQNIQDGLKIVTFEGISKVRAWEKGPKKRIYFEAVGVRPSLHKSGKVFVELVNGEWTPNLRYPIMTQFAEELNQSGIKDPEKIRELYEDYLNQY